MSEHYFSQTPGSADERHEVSATIWGGTATFTTSSGVFSQDGLDKATAVLLRHSTPPTGGVVLDLGCGWGPIACALAGTGAIVWAVDTNERALELTTLNASRLSLVVHTALPDEVPDGVMFDQIWSNPPIRIGKQALHDLLLRWLPRLTPDGTARLVVGKNLGADSLQRWLNDEGWPTERVASANTFRILEVRRAG